MHKIEITIGTEYTRSGKPLNIASGILAMHNARQLVCDAFGGGTQRSGKGIWRNPDTGEVVDEHVVTFVAYSDKWVDITELCQRIGRLFDQHTVALTLWRASGEFRFDLIRVNYDTESGVAA